MPWNNVMPQYGSGMLHSGSKEGPQVTSRKQAIAIMLNERAKAAYKPEYQYRTPTYGDTLRNLSRG